MNQYFSKNLPNIQRDVQKKCMLCYKEFRFGRAEHQCKRCLRAVCADCGTEKINVYKMGFNRTAHRGCRICVQELTGIHEYLRSNQIEFGRMSQVGEKWMKKIQKNTAFLPGDSKKANEFRKDVFSRMWDSYNYSLRQFIGLLTFEKPQQQIYYSVNSVVKAVLGVYPKQSLEGVAYLSIFVLCFCPVDSAILVCLFLLDLKTIVENTAGLITAYLGALGLDKQPRIMDFVKLFVRGFDSSISVNYSQVQSSIYLIDKIINRRKIQELHMFLALSVDIVKDMIIKGKGDISIDMLLMVRQCSPNAISYKYRQVAPVNIMPFLKHDEEEVKAVNTSMNLQQIAKSDQGQRGWLTTSYNQGAIPNSQSPIFSKDKELVLNQNQKFQKKYGQVEDSQPSEANISMISLIEEMKGLQQRPNPQPSEGGQLLAMLSGGEFTHHQYSQNESQKSIKRGFKDKNAQKPTNSYNRRSQKCQKCLYNQKKIQRLQQELKQYNNITTLAERFKEENETLKEKIKRQERLMESGEKDAARQNTLVMQKIQLEGQVRKINQTLVEYQLKDKELESVLIKYDETKKTVKQQEVELKSLRHQLQESNMTTKMLKNKVENQALKAPETQLAKEKRSQSTDSSFNDSKVLDILKQGIKDKNLQIQELSKRNKLLMYQLEEVNRLNKLEGNSSAKSMSTQKIEEEKEGMVRKMNELSVLLMNQEGQKLRLSEENFFMRQILKTNKIAYQL